MLSRLPLLSCSALLLTAASGLAEAPALPPANPAPLLRLEAGGPTSFVTALAFSRDGRTLYAAGWDKVVHVWALDRDGQFQLQKRAYRVPLGPGPDGQLNALALSDDDLWLAVGGTGAVRGKANFGEDSVLFPTTGAMDPTRRLDQGMIYVFNTKSGEVARLLRGHSGTVASLAFVPGGDERRTLLVSAGREVAEPDRWTGKLRLWEVVQGKNVALTSLPDPEFSRPGLAAWYGGPAGDSLQVAVDLADGRFRVWDVAANTVRSAASFKASPLAHLPGRDQVLTGVFGGGAPRLRVWDAIPGQDPRASRLEPVQGNGERLAPWAVGLASSRGDNRADLAAFVSFREEQRGTGEYRLQLLSLAAGELRGEVQRLWTGPLKLPALATSLRGDYLAAAVGEGHEVLVYRVADLLRGQPQVLRSAGGPISYAAFVRKGKDLGLVLNDHQKPKAPGGRYREPGEGDLVFDFAAPGLAADVRGWRLDVPAAGEWRAEQPDAGRPVISILRGERQVRQIALGGEKKTITDFALLPPCPPLQQPILAVAAHWGGQPLLALYNAATGDELRECAGHTDRIYSLAFSGDGRHLVSASEDQTVCVWSLTDLGAVLGEAGRIEGLGVTKDGQGSLTVAHLDPATPAREVLREGEVLEGIVDNGQLLRPTEPFDFYDAIDRHKPGTKVTLRVRRGQRAVDVAVPVSQEVDQRTPLFCLFLTRPEKGKEREWVGWNPRGPYEARSPEAERHLGWHFNTDEVRAPTRFASIDKYHDLYYRPGLLRKLLEDGKVPAPPPPPRPRLSLDAREKGAKGGLGAPARTGQVLLRRPDAQLHVWVAGRPLSTLDGVSYRVDDGPPHDIRLDAPTGQLLTAPLDLARGEHTVRVTVRAPDLGPEGYQEELSVRYQPPAPRLVPDGETSLTVKQPDFTLKADLFAGRAGEDVDVTFYQDGQQVGEATTHAADPVQATALSREFRLVRGRNNRLEVVAVNHRALAGHKGDETTRRAVDVFLVQKGLPPRLVLDGVLPDGRPRDQALPLRRGEPLVVTVPKVHILGSVEGEQDLVEAEWFPAGGDKATPLPTFAASQKKAAIDVSVEFPKPGSKQTLRFRARTDTSDRAERDVTLVFRPPVPQVRVTAPADDDVVYGEKETGEVVLQGEVVPPYADYPYDYRVKVLRDGREPEGAPAARLDRKARTVTARVPLHPGTNRLQLQCVTDWDEPSASEPVRVRYLRPPVGVELTGPARTQKPSVDLEARVRSPLPLLPKSARVEVNGERRRVEVTVDEQQPAPGAWTVRLKRVPLDPAPKRQKETTNAIRLVIGNAEGECREPGTATVVHEQLRTPPEVAVVQPRGEGPVRTPEVTVRYRVRSDARLEQVRLVSEDGKSIPADVSRAVKKEKYFLLEVETPVVLKPGVNKFQAEAVDDEGERKSQDFTINYVPRPVRLVLDSLSDGGEEMKPKRSAGGGTTFAPVRAGRAVLKGRVVWDAAGDEGLRQAAVVRLAVNGFQQRPAALGPAEAGGRERPFEADLLLNQEQDNQVWLALPNLPNLKPEDGQTEFQVDCASPKKALRLHLLIVSPVAKDETALKKQFFNAFGIEGPDDDHLRTKVFDPVYLYGPQVDYYADRRFVDDLLGRIQSSIEESAGPANDLVVIYYQGEEVIDDKGDFFLTRTTPAAAGKDNRALRANELAGLFRDTPGAFVLLLDVDRQAAKAGGPPGKDDVADWGANYPESAHNSSVLRYAWLGQPGPRPNARLLAALQAGMPRAKTTRFDELIRAVREFAARVPDINKGFWQHDYVANEMKDIPIR